MKRIVKAATWMLVPTLALAVSAPDASAVVVCERLNRRGVVKRVTLRPGSECAGPRERTVLDLAALTGAGGGPAAVPGAVGLGSIIAHSTHLPGSASVQEMQARGFAVCDGSTPGSQSITGAVLTGPTPDLNGPGLFLRGTEVATGVVQDDATAVGGLEIVDEGHSHASAVGDFCGQEGPGSIPSPAVAPRAFWDEQCPGGLYPTGSSPANVTLASDADETRPVNMSVIWMIRVR